MWAQRKRRWSALTVRSALICRARLCCPAWATPTCTSSLSARLIPRWTWAAPPPAPRHCSCCVTARRRHPRASGSRAPTLTSPSGRTARTGCPPVWTWTRPAPITPSSSSACACIQQWPTPWRWKKPTSPTATCTAPAAWWSWTLTAIPTAFSVSKPPKFMIT